jgi:hypothetical protein
VRQLAPDHLGVKRNLLRTRPHRLFTKARNDIKSLGPYREGETQKEVEDHEHLTVHLSQDLGCCLAGWRRCLEPNLLGPMAN